MQWGAGSERLTLNVESPNIAKGGGTTHVRGRRRKEHQKTAREGPHNGGRGWGGSTSGSEGARDGYFFKLCYA
jgi:hypothetical protein